MSSNKQLYYHNNCTYLATEAEWDSVFVYNWHFVNEDIIFVRCPKCKSDIAKQSLKKYQLDKI